MDRSRSFVSGPGLALFNRTSCSRGWRGMSRRNCRTQPLRRVLAGVGFQDPQDFCDRLGALMRAVARRDDAFALRAVHV
jgi:hypothetical protein